ncbi:DUF5916 domain-containing protein [Rubrivirga sp. IMCC45206]|uniref:DUF5916 domain-containing protein n=1 Tax=Rubrivirga sp. IMCC45206 TaxID=3391614 RepID=UPI00398FA8EA
MLALLLALLLPPPTVTAAPAESVVIDGVLDEAAWAGAEPASGFVQFEPTEGVPASNATTVRVLRTPTGLVIGARMDGTQIRTPLSRRDDGGEADQFVVAIDSYDDDRTAYLFGVTAAGVQFDGIVEGNDDDDSWDAVWTSSVRVDATGWTAELSIPYSQLRFSGTSRSWGINFQRVSPATGEESFWAPITRAEASGGLVRLFGQLDGVDGLTPRPVLQVVPYTLTGASRRESETVPGTAATGFEGNLGADLKLGLGSAMILDATVNPDFGQVEADPAELNLGTFETIFQERRPFFTEGTQIFDLTVGGGRDGALLYTRRIGGASPIIAATKLTGRTPGGLSFGALAAATGDDFAPSRTYAAARVKQEFAGQSYIGAGLTAYAAQSDPADGVPSARSLAAAGDWGLRFADERWIFEGSAAGTARSEDGGDGAVGAALYTGLDRTQGYFLPGFGLRLYSDDFRLNDVGRFRQTDVAQLRGGARQLWNQGEPVGPFRRINSGGFVTQTWTLSDGASQGLSVFTFNNAEFQGFQEIGLNVRAGGLGGVNVRETRGLGPVRNLRELGVNLSYESDSRQRVRFEVGVEGGVEEGGGREVGVGGEVEWTASDRVALSLGGGVSSGDGRRAWASNESFFATDAGLFVGAIAGEPGGFADTDLVALDADPAVLAGLVPSTDPLQVSGQAFYAPVFGARDTRQVDLTARAQVIFGPGVSLQLYGQVFAARGQYRDFSLLAAEDDLRPLLAFPKRLDFSLASFTGNAVFRWEYRPGSTLFVVWSQGREDSLFEETLRQGAGPSPFETGSVRQLGDTFDAFPDDVVLVKLNYLLMR